MKTPMMRNNDLMKSLFNRSAQPIIGLDIGTRFIKAVLLEKTGDSYTVAALACEPINGNAFAEREIKDFDMVSQCLKKIKLGLKKKKIKDVAIAVAGPSVLTKVVQMQPEQTDYQLEGQIEIEADSLIPYPLEEVYLDFEELGPSKTHMDQVNVLLSAAHKDIVDARVTLIREIPFEPKIIDIEGYAMANAVTAFHGADEQATVCINIGASLLQVSVTKNGNVEYSKEHNFGTDALLQDICESMMLERDDAQNQLLNGELPETWKQEILPIFASSLQQHINRAMQMYISAAHANRPEKLLLSGGGAVITELATLLEQDLGVMVEVFNPFSNMQFAKHIDVEKALAIGPQMVIAAGLASRSFNPWHI